VSRTESSSGKVSSGFRYSPIEIPLRGIRSQSSSIYGKSSSVSSSQLVGRLRGVGVLERHAEALALCHLVSTLCHTPPRDTRLPHVETAHPAIVECRVGLFRCRRPSRTLVAVCFRTSRWISVLQIWQLRHCRLQCGLVELWFPLTPVLRNFRGLLSAYVVYIKLSLEDRILICFGQVEFPTGRAIPMVAYLSLSFIKTF
jgi:hypothetical protein